MSDKQPKIESDQIQSLKPHEIAHLYYVNPNLFQETEWRKKLGLAFEKSAQQLQQQADWSPKLFGSNIGISEQAHQNRRPDAAKLLAARGLEILLNPDDKPLKNQLIAWFPEKTNQ